MPASSDQLLRHLDNDLASVRATRSAGTAPVYLAAVTQEHDWPRLADYKPRLTDLAYPSVIDRYLHDALHHPALGVCGTTRVWKSWGPSGYQHWAWFVPDGSADAGEQVIEAADRMANRLSDLVSMVPPDLIQRLGLRGQGGAEVSNWPEVLVRFGWHFPDQGIYARRYRIQSGRDGLSEEAVPEFCLQLGWVTATPDVFPGVIFSRLDGRSDFWTATERALELIRTAVTEVGRGAALAPGDSWREVHRQFQELADFHDQLLEPMRPTGHVLRLTNSFHTRAATEWADLDLAPDGRTTVEFYCLSQFGADRVVCAVREDNGKRFFRLADRAGAFVPRWPDRQPAGPLCNPYSFARFCRSARLPEVWPFDPTATGGLVTDHRGNVERWLGLVVTELTRHGEQYLSLRPSAEECVAGYWGQPVNLSITLHGIDWCRASALTIERLGLIPAAPPPTPFSVEGNTDGTGRVPNSSRKGRKRTYDSELDEAFARDWKQAQEAGVAFKHFCKDRGCSVSNGTRALDRVRNRKK